MLYAYTRVSTTAQAQEGYSLEVQGRTVEGWAMMRGETIGSTFVERGVSGSIPIRERPAGAKLWGKLQKGDMIVVSKLDRMFRDARDALNTVEELKQMGVSLVLLDLGHDPVTNGLSKVFMTIAAAFSDMERVRISERQTAAKADAKAQGRYLGGKVPFGFTVSPQGTLEPIEGDQAVIERAKKERASGASLRAVQATLIRELGRKLSLDAISRIVSPA